MNNKSALPTENKDYSANFFNEKNKIPKSSRYSSFDTSCLKYFCKNSDKLQHEKQTNIKFKDERLEKKLPSFSLTQSLIIPGDEFDDKDEINSNFMFSDQMVFIKDNDGVFSNNHFSTFNTKSNHSRQGSHFFGELCPIYEYEDDITNQFEDDQFHNQEIDRESFNTPRMKWKDENKSLNFESPLIKSQHNLQHRKSIFSTECTNEDSKHNSQKSLRGMKNSKSFVYSDSDESSQKMMTMSSRPFYPLDCGKTDGSEDLSFDGKRLNTENCSNYLAKKKGRKSLPEMNLDKFKIKKETVLKDPRTTLMIRNIANKYDYYLFLSLINQNFEGKYDFFYLPVDFKNKCNIGYAFINIPEKKDILTFYMEFNNRKWVHFNSEKVNEITKVCEITYARIQGKEKLIQHFRFSKIMNQQERSHRPLIVKDSTRKLNAIKALVEKQRHEMSHEESKH